MMCVFKGTPGPWFWQGDGCGYSWLGPKDCDPSDAVHHDGSSWGEYSPDIDVYGPDAHLIAAAPELLEALQDLVKGHEAEHEYEFASSVIAKAIGEQRK